ncbi:hypothetical protein NC651_009409 [Populus alba x Populus x berolinensis]|nr:hypothetical protein NC651_009409 [Populus alba x Populus x berolinensis]
MEHPPTIFMVPEPPPFPSSPRSVDLAPLEFILAFIAVIAVPALIYTFFFSIKCPPRPFRRRRHHRSSSSVISETLSVADIADTGDLNGTTSGDQKERASDVKFQKDTHVKDVGSECPVCLSVFSDGEAVKQLSVCKHSFHAPCIDMWLSSNSNCPVCRASTAPPAKHPGKNASSSTSRNNVDDLQQGLPDAANDLQNGEGGCDLIGSNTDGRDDE